MKYQNITKVPVNDEYSFILGKAIYIFSYYEWIIINIMEKLNPGFVNYYSRPINIPLTSGKVKSEFYNMINQNTFPKCGINKTEFDDCYKQFDALIEKRNALIHAHPITDIDGSQILSYQTKPNMKFSDIIWTVYKVEELIQDFDKAAVSALIILDKLRNK